MNILRRASVACSPIKENYTPLKETIVRAEKLVQSQYDSLIFDEDKVILEEK